MNAAPTSRSLRSARRAAASSPAGVLTIGALALPGCFAPQNDSNALGGATTLTALNPDTPTGIRTASAATPDAPSLPRDSFSRNHWAVARFSVPLDAPAHQPTYSSGGPSYATDLPRQRGERPTAASALDLSTRQSAGHEIAEGFAAPLWAAFDLGLMPARMLLVSPFASAHAPDRTTVGRERAPQAWTGTPAAPAVPAQAPADAAPVSAGPPQAVAGSPTSVPAAAPAPAAAQAPAVVARVAAPPPPIPAGYWVFREGHWVQGDQPAAAAPPQPAPAPEPKP